MKQLWKRNAVVGTILVFVCAAIFLNGKYAEKVDKPTKVLGQSELVSTDGDAAEVSANAEGKDTSVRMCPFLISHIVQVLPLYCVERNF